MWVHDLISDRKGEALSEVKPEGEGKAEGSPKPAASGVTASKLFVNCCCQLMKESFFLNIRCLIAAESKVGKYAPKGTIHPMDCTDIVIGMARGPLHRVHDYYTRDRYKPTFCIHSVHEQELIITCDFVFQVNTPL